MFHYRKNELSTNTAFHPGLFYKPNPRTPGAPRVGGYAKIYYFFRKFFTGNRNLNAKVEILAAPEIPIITYTVGAKKSSH